MQEQFNINSKRSRPVDFGDVFDPTETELLHKLEESDIFNRGRLLNGFFTCKKNGDVLGNSKLSRECEKTILTRFDVDHLVTFYNSQKYTKPHDSSTLYTCKCGVPYISILSINGTCLSCYYENIANEPGLISIHSMVQNLKYMRNNNSIFVDKNLISYEISPYHYGMLTEELGNSYCSSERRVDVYQKNPIYVKSLYQNNLLEYIILKKTKEREISQLILKISKEGDEIVHIKLNHIRRFFNLVFARCPMPRIHQNHIAIIGINDLKKWCPRKRHIFEHKIPINRSEITSWTLRDEFVEQYLNETKSDELDTNITKDCLQWKSYFDCWDGKYAVHHQDMSPTIIERLESMKGLMGSRIHTFGYDEIDNPFKNRCDTQLYIYVSSLFQWIEYDETKLYETIQEDDKTVIREYKSYTDTMCYRFAIFFVESLL